MAQLDRNRIAVTALEVLDEHGMSGFTIRAVGAALGVTPMAIYHHVENKSELARLIVDLAHNESPMDPLSGDWKEDLWGVARWTRQTTLAHPAVQELRRVYAVYTPEMFGVAERWMTIWKQSGLPPEMVDLAARVSGIAIGGMVMQEELLRNLDPPDDALLQGLPSVKVMYQAESNPGMAFELAVRSQIDGLYERLQRASLR